jgi:hypothetical protein
MTVPTLDRRSFFSNIWKHQSKEAKQGIFGRVKSLLPPGSQELPAVSPPATAIVIGGGLAPYTGPWDYAQAAHLLRRTGFGIKKSDLDMLMAMNMEEAVNYVLNVNTDDLTPPVNNYYNGNAASPDGYDDPVVPLGEVWVDADYDENAEGYRIESFRGWWFDRMIYQEPTILERLTLFWHNHFATQSEAVFYGKTNYRHNWKLRTHALGNFKELTKVITLDPMMLYYLNGYLNSAESPDENYARELQELFTIGKDNPNHFTEQDVVEAARVLTGWRVKHKPSDTYFDPDEHDTGDKHFSSFYNNTTIEGSTDGEAELDALLDMIFAKKEVAEYVCRKLYRWFVYYHIDETVEQQVIQPLAEIFRNSSYEIKPVIETLLKSEHFFDAANKGCFIKTPVDIVIGTMRSFNIGSPGSTPWDDFTMRYILTYFLYNMQMLPGDPPNVAGWQAFRQSPQYYRVWINGDTARNRNYFTDILATYYLETDNDQLKIDPIAFASQFDNPANPVALVDDVTRLLLPQPLSTAKKTLLKSILLSGQLNDSYWTSAWLSYQNNPNDEMAFKVVNVRLKVLLKYVMGLPEYQLA